MTHLFLLKRINDCNNNRIFFVLPIQYMLLPNILYNRAVRIQGEI